MAPEIHCPDAFTLTRDFLYGGKAMFSVTTDTGVRFTYRVSYRPPEGEYAESWFIHLQTSNEKWRYLGKLSTPTAQLTFWPTAKTPAEECRAAILAFRWALDSAMGLALPAGWSLNHCGKCSRCGRGLKTRKSNQLGIGPECIKKGVQP